MFVIILQKRVLMRFLIIFIAGLLFAVEIKPVIPVKYNKQKAKIGKMLFCDKTLSKHKDISCNSCHNLKNYGVDNMRFSVGSGGIVDKPMNTLSVYNAVYNVAFFWNGRAENLEDQVIESLTDKKEHGLCKKEIVDIVSSNQKYVKLFKKFYSQKPNIHNIANAIAEFEKSLITPDCRFDRYLKGDKNAITQKEKRGYYKFKMYGCITCHNGRNVGGNSFQKLGVFLNENRFIRGLDRYEVTKLITDKFVYKVPSLRNVEKTYPYFHDGSVKSLKKAISLMGELNLGIELSKKDVDDIEAFLKTLTGDTVK